MQISKTKVFAVKIITTALFLGAVNFSHADDASQVSDKPVVEQLVDTLIELAHGPYKGYRANHAKGIMVSGTFTPAAGAASLSKAPHLQKASSPVLVRFSDATGLPTIPDASADANPHGMAIRFQLADGAYTDIVSISINGFPAATPEEFLEFLNAVAASGPDAPKPSPVEKFLGAHPAALKFATTPAPARVSFATQAFYGVNAFSFTNARGKTLYGRYRITPLAGVHALTKKQAAKAAPDYLMQELPARLKKGPAKFRISVQLALTDDVINDGTVVWPENRPQVELGILTLKTALQDSQQLEKTLMFSPLNLTDGIAASDDPILLARPAAYAISFGRRLGN
ncbi:MAG TPA: catalase family peroxidase [Burkholderiales bacterium]